MEPLNRPYRNREEANGESMIPVDRQPDDLRTRIAAVLNSHKADDRYDEWSDCQCGNVGTRWDDHVADAVIRELETGYVLVPKNVTLVQWADEAFKGQPEGAFKYEHVTEWEPDD